MQVVITLSPAGDRVIVASDLPVWDVLPTYRKRWGIECSFSAMKTRGLNLEATHMTAPERISRLFGLLCIVLAWLVRVGEAEQALHPPKKDNRNRLARSQVKVGWNQLSETVRWGLEAFRTHLALLNTPFPSPSARKPESVSC